MASGGSLAGTGGASSTDVHDGPRGSGCFGCSGCCRPGPGPGPGAGEPVSCRTRTRSCSNRSDGDCGGDSCYGRGTYSCPDLGCCFCGPPIRRPRRPSLRHRRAPSPHGSVCSLVHAWPPWALGPRAVAFLRCRFCPPSRRLLWKTRRGPSTVRVVHNPSLLPIGTRGVGIRRSSLFWSRRLPRLTTLRRLQSSRPSLRNPLVASVMMRCASTSALPVGPVTAAK
jgi:hypothetical protein